MGWLCASHRRQGCWRTVAVSKVGRSAEQASAVPCIGDEIDQSRDTLAEDTDKLEAKICLASTDPLRLRDFQQKRGDAENSEIIVLF